jgi:hypothetical protein
MTGTNAQLTVSPGTRSTALRALKRLCILTLLGLSIWCVAGSAAKHLYWSCMLTNRGDYGAARHLLLEYPPGKGAELLDDAFRRSPDPRVRHAIVWAWSDDRDLVSMHGLCDAAQDPNQDVRVLALAGLEIRAVESNELARALAHAIAAGQSDPEVRRRLVRLLAALSYGTFALPEGASGDAAAAAARSWADANHGRFEPFLDDALVPGRATRPALHRASGAVEEQKTGDH